MNGMWALPADELQRLMDKCERLGCENAAAAIRREFRRRATLAQTTLATPGRVAA